MSIDVDQATVDRWRADGRWAMFGEGSGFYSDNPEPFGKVWEARPPAWMMEAARPCENRYCDDGVVRRDDGRQVGYCTLCVDGKRRLAVTVPCDYCRGNKPPKNIVAPPCWKCVGRHRTTAAWATVEWGPLVVVGFGIDGDVDYVRLSDDTKVTPPPDIDPHTLIGQWAIGGTIEVAS